MSSLIGRTLGQYEVIEMLGRGGMATVYLGRQISVDRYVAIKVLPPHPGLDEQFKQRFELEAKTIGSLQNPNILPLYDYGTDGDVLYLVMAYVESGTLEDMMDSGPMDVRTVERILRSVASGLDFAHRKGVIHRDVKPANILISDGHPLLADFGMVKMAAGSSNLTGTAIVGTPSYMAPEQGRGLLVDERVDIYALGVMLYEMLAGKHPYQGETPMQTILMHINDPIPDILSDRPDLPSDIAYVIEKAMAKEPDDRFATAGDLAEAFTSALHQDSDSLVDIRENYPINQQKATTQLPSAAGMRPDTVITPREHDSTIVIRESTNPFVLLGGFGLIALVIVIVAILLIDRGNDTTVPELPTEVVANATTRPTAASAASTPLPTVPAVITFGDVFFSTATSLGDAVTVSVNELAVPESGTFYAAWLLNTESEDTLALGRLIVTGFGKGSLNYIDTEGRILPVQYNALIITTETELSDAPAGAVAYRAEVPLAVSSALGEILVTSPSGFEKSGEPPSSLLEGALSEAGFAAQHAGLAANASDIGGIRSHGEHTINIVNGTLEDYNGNGRGENPGRKIGLFTFLDAIDSVLSDAKTQPDATVDLEVNAENIVVCVENVRIWANEVVGKETTLFTTDDFDTALAAATEVSQTAALFTTGVDLNDNGVVEAFEGECGLNQIEGFALETARMQIVEADSAED